MNVEVTLPVTAVTVTPTVPDDAADLMTWIKSKLPGEWTQVFPQGADPGIIYIKHSVRLGNQLMSEGFTINQGDSVFIIGGRLFVGPLT